MTPALRLAIIAARKAATLAFTADLDLGAAERHGSLDEIQTAAAALRKLAADLEEASNNVANLAFADACAAYDAALDLKVVPFRRAQ